MWAISSDTHQLHYIPKHHCIYVIARMQYLYKFLAVADEPGKRHARRANKPLVDSDWLNPNYSVT